MNSTNQTEALTFSADTKQQTIKNEGTLEQNATADKESAPLCKNGVCELNWKPQRPQAA